jgi:hypothetical protein
MPRTFKERIKKTLDNTKITDEQIVRFEDILRDNSCRSSTQAMSSLLLFIIFTIVWLLVKSSYIQKFTISGIEINNPQLLLIIIPPIAAFFYYNYICLFTFSCAIEETLRPLYGSQMQAFAENSLIELMGYPDFFNSENALANLLQDDKNSLLYRFSRTWSVVTTLVILYIPALILFSMIYELVIYSFFDKLIPVVSALFVALLLIRSLMITVGIFKLV